ncbi:hypothetical protein O2U53_004477 [Vibrio vulnificus]|nr:hypothetical protein [Vibrio vulnificus]
MENRDYWDSQLFDRLLFEQQRTILYSLPKGSQFKVTRAVQYPWGESGHKWVLRAMFSDIGQEVELPTIALLTDGGKTWIESEFMKKPVLLASYAVQCKN